MKIETEGGLTVEIWFEDGFPIVNIETNGHFYGDRFRPAVQVNLNEVKIFEMFDNGPSVDTRWEKQEPWQAPGFAPFKTRAECIANIETNIATNERYLEHAEKERQDAWKDELHQLLARQRLHLAEQQVALIKENEAVTQ